MFCFLKCSIANIYFIWRNRTHKLYLFTCMYVLEHGPRMGHERGILSACEKTTRKEDKNLVPSKSSKTWNCTWRLLLCAPPGVAVGLCLLWIIHHNWLLFLYTPLWKNTFLPPWLVLVSLMFSPCHVCIPDTNHHQLLTSLFLKTK